MILVATQNEKKEYNKFGQWCDYIFTLVSVKKPHWSQHPTEKDDPDPVVADSDPLVASSVLVLCARNSQREGGRSLPRQGLDHHSQWDVGINVGFFTETTGSLRNPETRHNPSYVHMYKGGGWAGWGKKYVEIKGIRKGNLHMIL